MAHHPLDPKRDASSFAADLPGLLRRLGLVVFRRAADSTLRFLDVEGRATERMGVSNAVLTGDAYSFWTRVDPEDRRRVLSVLEDAVRKGSEYRVCYRLQDTHGQVHAVREEGAAIFGADGAVESLTGVICEASDELAEARRERVESAAQESRERFLTFARHSTEMIAEISSDRAIAYVNPLVCQEIGRSAGELEGCDPVSLIHPQDREHVLATCLESIRTGEDAQVLCRLERADGGWLWAELGGGVFRGAGGELRGVVTGRNVENRVRVEETLLSQRLAEARIGKLSRRFIELGPEGLDEAIREGVEAAGTIAGADRCYLLAVRSDRGVDSSCYVWQREGLSPWTPEIADQSGRHAWMRQRIHDGELIRIPRVRELPDEYAETREDLMRRGIQSYLLIPVRSGGRVTALLCCQGLGAEHDWSEQDLALLRLVAELFASALHRRDVEGALRDGEQRLRALTDGAQDAICENELAQGEILYANPYFYEMHGYTPEEARGMNSFDFMHPEDLEIVRRMHRAFERGAFGEALSGTLLYRGCHRDGSWRWLEANGRLFRTASGAGRSAAVIRDVTDRQAAQKAMERRLENQTRIANLARDLLALGLDGIDAGITEGLVAVLPISGADRSWLVSFDQRRNVQQSWEWCADGVAPPGIAIDEADLDEFPDTRNLFRDGRHLLVPSISALDPEGPEARFLGRRGTSSTLAIPLLSGNDVVGAIGFEMVGRERTWSDETIALLRLGGEVFVSALSRKRAEEALRESRGQLLQAQKMEAVGTLAGGVAHDFNNQLSVILGNARFVRAEVEGDPELREAMADLERAGEHCAQLTRSLLSFSRHVPAEPRATSVSQVLLDVQELTGPLLSSGIHFEVEAHGEVDCVYADRTQLQQVLVNLVVNARDAMPDGGNLSIRTYLRQLDAEEAARVGVPEAGDYVQFDVADTGFGMDAETVSRIFEPFFTTKDPGKGTGLGLATVYGILQESRGTVWAESAVGVGTTFRLLLPRAEGAGGEASPVQGARTLLLVENEESVRRLLRRMLDRMGFRVLEARDGNDALRVSADHGGTIDVLVSDVAMPGMGGVELGRRLLECRPSLRVLLVVGHADEDVSLPGARLLCKPFREEELSWALQALLSPA